MSIVPRLDNRFFQRRPESLIRMSPSSALQLYSNTLVPGRTFLDTILMLLPLILRFCLAGPTDCRAGTECGES